MIKNGSYPILAGTTIYAMTYHPTAKKYYRSEHLISVRAGRFDP